MTVAIVKFSEHGKEYTFKTDVKLKKGHFYYVTSNKGDHYTTPVRVERLYFGETDKDFKTIVAAEEVRYETSIYGGKWVKVKEELAMPKIKKVYFNPVKGATTVVWDEEGDDDECRTTIKCSANDDWDEEKAIAICFMKKMFGNDNSFKAYMKEARNNAARICNKKKAKAKAKEQENSNQ